MSADRAEFSLAGELPWQRATAIEASAGTGKTYALSGLVVRYVAEQGVPIDEILVVTFTKAATAELRERVRSRLVEVHDGLAELAAGAAAEASTGADPVLVVLSADPARRPEFLERLRRAVLDFDSATISTIHGFCAQARTAMGVRFGGNPDATATEAGAGVVASVCNDLLIREALDPDSTWLEDGVLSAEEFGKLVDALRRLPDSEVASVIDDDIHRHLVSLVQEAAADIDRRMTSSGSLTYDTLITSVRDELRDHAEVVEQLQERFQVALIDEFQDTDSAQWEIFSTVFGPTTRRTLVVVGDPKQAIYAFRGGDVHTYLDAVGSEGVEVLRLAENQRSDRAVVEAVNALGAGHTLGSDRIVIEPVRATPRLDGRHLALAAGGPPAQGMQVRFVTAASVAGDSFSAPESRQRVADDLVDVVLGLLDGAVIHHPDGTDRPVRPSDIAVLVQAKTEAEPIADGFREAGVPSVLLLQESVASSEAYEQLGVLFAALERPSDRRRAASAALGWWLGWSSGQLAAAADSDESAEAARLVEFQHQLVTWAGVLTDEGLPALYGRIRAEGDLLERMMATGSGERHLTDLEQLVELVHAERRGSRGMSPASASAALAALSAGDHADELAVDAVQRRVDSDAAAVTLMTIHKAKGLEFPIVLLPSLYGGGNRVKAERPYTYYEPAGAPGGRGHRVVDLACRDVTADGLGAGAGDADGDGDGDGGTVVVPQERALEEQCGDQHRMTYVALTRAAHHTVVWWAATSGQHGRKKTGLARLLFSDEPTAPAAADVAMPAAGGEAAAFRERVTARGADEWISVVEVGPPGARPAPYRPDRGPARSADVEARRLERNLERAERRWSYTGLSKAAGHDEAGSHGSGDPDDETGADSGADDEPVAPPAAAIGVTSPADPTDGDGTGGTGEATGAEWDRPSPFEGLGAGREFGTMVHTVFEHVDFGSDTLGDDLRNRILVDTSWRTGEDTVDALVAALEQVVRTPLGPAFGDLTMAGLAPADRLDELRFDLPLAPESAVPAARIGEVVERHLAGTPYGEWATGLADRLGRVQLQGVLTGSIDLVLRRATDSGPSYSVVDYKTNNLTPTGEAHLLRHYDPSDPVVVRRGMLDTNYALQAVVYSVVLHRYLRWRQPGYDPAVHLGPVGYFFVRGMVGPDTPVGPNGGRAGVISWELPVGLIVELDELLARGGTS